MPDSPIILGRKRREVRHRATGRLLGTYGQRDDPSGSRHRHWSVWAPWPEWGADGAVGDEEPFLEDAALHLLDTALMRPEVAARRCRRCRARNLDHCDVDCEPMAEAEARSRAEHPTWWDHWDWLVQLEAT